MANGTWKIARNKGGGQLPIALLAALAVALLLIGKAQNNLFDRARARITDWAAPALEAVRSPFVGLDRWMGSIGEIFVVYRENLRLKDENARLRQWRSAAIVLDDRVKRYQLLLHAVPDPALSSVLAHVIGRAKRPFLETMILDAGKADGVKPGQAVIDTRGMIGRIFLTGEHTSWVILLSDLNSRIPVISEPGHAQAILTGDNAKAPALETLAQGAVVHEGDQVVSSGDGGILPPGLPIGTVVADGGGFRVALLADPASTQDVEIVDFKNPIEMPSAPTAKDLPVAAAGLPPATPPPAPAGNATSAAPAAIAPGNAATVAPKPLGVTPVPVKPKAAPPAPAPAETPADDQ
jgi:rod shape-determining protein MreC